MYGYHGRYLRIHVGTGSCQALPLAEDLLARVIGGVGLGVWLLLRESPPGYDALGPEAPLVLAFAPLAGTQLNTTAKAAVLCKSPLTQRLNDAMISSQIALSGKGTGADALVILGACPQLSTLFVDAEGCRVLPTQELAGLTAAEAEEHIHARWGEGWSVAAIGPAGERLVPFATLSHDGRHAGRGGTGAVLGSKGLKAIAVRGGALPRIAQPEQMDVLRRALQQASLGPGTEKYRSTGTMGNLLVFNRIGILPTQNFQAGSHPQADQLGVERLYAAGQVVRATCKDCMIGCEKRVVTGKGRSTRLEYENVFSLGAMQGIWDMDLVVRASQRCDDLGLDTITMGGTLAFARECAQHGLLEIPALLVPAEQGLLPAIELTAERREYGDLLALGSRGLAQRVGQGSAAFAAHVKGLELPGYHPGALQTLALGFAVGARGADHNKSSAYDLDLSGTVDRFQLDAARVDQMVDLEDQAVLIDSLILCKFVRRALGDLFGEGAAMLTALTGREHTPQGLRQVAATIHDLKKLFNQREGWTAAEDTLPSRFFTAPHDGPAPGATPRAGVPPAPAGAGTIDPAQFQAARARYYQRRGWDPQGCLAPGLPWLRDLLPETPPSP